MDVGLVGAEGSVGGEVGAEEVEGLAGDGEDGIGAEGGGDEAGFGDGDIQAFGGEVEVVGDGFRDSLGESNGLGLRGGFSRPRCHGRV
jgi:hypothetical protein